MLNWLIQFSLKYRFLVLLSTCMLVVFGLISLSYLDIDAVPDTSSTQVQINTSAPTMTPEQVERQITAPLEQELSGLPSVEQVRSISKFGLSQVVLIFEDGTDQYFARQQVTERINRAKLPPGVDSPRLGPVSTGLGEIFHYVVVARGVNWSALTEEQRTARLTELRTIHDWVIRPQMRTVRGASEVSSWGGYEKQFQIIVDPLKLVKHGITFSQIIDAMERSSRSVGGGDIRRNSEMILVQGTSRFTNIEDIRNVSIDAKMGNPLRIRDVAEVRIGTEVRRGSVTVNGKGEAVMGLAFMLTGQNSHTVAREFQTRLNEIRQSLPPDVDVEVLYDRTELVDQVIATARDNLFFGGLMVVAVLFAFLGNLRAAAIVAVAIPLSMMFAFAGMVRFGIAASLLSLGAIDFGMVVDSSVVLMENCVRHIAHAGASSASRVAIVRDAAVEVRKPTLFGELIIMIVYLPILTLEGVEGKMFRPMALTVVFALCGSMILSLTLMPVLASLGLPRRITEREPLLMRLAHRIHNPILQVCMNHRFAVVLMALTVAGVAFGMMAPYLGTEFVPKLSEGAIAINVVRLAGTDLAESNRLNTVMERAVLQEFPDEVRAVWSRVGSADITTDPMGVELTDFYVMLHPRKQWKKASNQRELTKKVDAILRELPGQKLSYSQPIEMRIEEMETGTRADVGVMIYGDDLDVLVKNAKKIEDILKTVPGSADVAAEQVTGQPILKIEPKWEEMARYRVSAKAVMDVVESVSGKPLGEVIDGPMRFALVARLPDRLRTGPEAMGNILLPTATGERVPLSRVATLSMAEGPSTIHRDWGQRRIVVTANVPDRDTGSFVAEARAKVASEFTLPPGRYHLEWTGSFQSYERARLRLLIVVPAAVFLIFLLLCFTYRNLVDALRVFTGVPLGWVGGIIALWLRDMPFSISAAVGFIAMSGVAVLDDMILVSYIRQLRQKGFGVNDAVRQAAVTRLRPVLMTTLVASLGFLPMAFSTGVGAEVQRPLATVVIGGVVGAMVMSLLVLRVLYLFFDWLAQAVHHTLVRWLRINATLASSWLGFVGPEAPGGTAVAEGDEE